MQHDDEIMEDNSPETQKAKLKVLQQEFAAEMKKKTEKIKPRLIGCIWMNGDEDEDGGSKVDNLEKKYHCSDIIWRILKAREMMSSGEEIKMEDFEPEVLESEEDNNNGDEKTSTKQQKTPAPIKVRPKIEGDSVKELMRLLHGNVNSKKFLIKEFQAYRLKKYHKLPDFQEFSVKNVEEKIMEISLYKTCPDEGPLFSKKCWYVKEEIMKEFFGDEKLPIPNVWTYILEKEKKTKTANNNKDGGDSKKGSREVSPTDEHNVAAKEATNSAKIIPESPKTNGLKITNFIKNSPKTPTTSRDSKPTSHTKSKTPMQKTTPKVIPSTPNMAKTNSLIMNNTGSPIQIKSVASIQSKPSTPTSQSNNSSPKIQQTALATNSGKKRVALLMSVKPGQSINTEQKNQLVNQFLKSNQNTKSDAKPTNEIIEIID